MSSERFNVFFGLRQILKQWHLDVSVREVSINCLD